MSERLPEQERFGAAHGTIRAILKGMEDRLISAGLTKASVSLVSHTDSIPSFLIYRGDGSLSGCIQSYDEAQAKIDRIVTEMWSPAMVAATLGMECGA